nr:hypothetical protein [Tanacetum cinerariifolium]
MPNPSNESSYPSPVKVDVPSELPKVSLVNTSLKKLKSYLAKSDSMVKTRITPSALTEGKSLCPQSIKNDLRKLKGKDAVDNAAQASNATTIAPGISKPTCNKKNDRISQPSSSNIKNKVEAQPRKVNKKNHVVEPICDVNVKHTMLNVNSQLNCVTLHLCLNISSAIFFSFALPMTMTLQIHMLHTKISEVDEPCSFSLSCLDVDSPNTYASYSDVFCRFALLSPQDEHQHEDRLDLLGEQQKFYMLSVVPEVSQTSFGVLAIFLWLVAATEDRLS